MNKQNEPAPTVTGDRLTTTHAQRVERHRW